jgi:hypothetical protein
MAGFQANPMSRRDLPEPTWSGNINKVRQTPLTSLLDRSRNAQSHD